MAELIVKQEHINSDNAQKLEKICPFGAISFDGKRLEISSACKMCKLCVKKGGGLIEYKEDEVSGVDKSLWQGICVYVDHRERNIHRVTCELLGKARELAQVTG